MMDEFDMMDDEVQLLLENEQEKNTRASSSTYFSGSQTQPSAESAIVTVRLTWGRNLTHLLQLPQPVTVPYGTAASYHVLASYFQHKDHWPEQEQKLNAQPALLLDTLEFAAGIQSLELFMVLCRLFKERFATLQLPWPLDDTAKIKKCGDLIRTCFEATGIPTQKASSATASAAATGSTSGRQHGPYDHLLDYFTSGGLNLKQEVGRVLDVGSLTHSVDPRMVYAQMENQATNDIDFSDFLSKLDPFRQRVWQPDSEADRCPSCGSYFAQDYRTYFTGVSATHCRCCGKRKCVKCCPYKLEKSIARLSKPGAPEEENMRTVCVDCYKQARVVQRSAFLSQVFIHAGLDIIQISMMRTVNTIWSAAAELTLNEHRQSLYRFHTVESMSVPNNTKRLLRNSIRLLDGHPEQLILLFLSLEWDDPEMGLSNSTAATSDESNRRDPNAPLPPSPPPPPTAAANECSLELKLAVDALVKTVNRLTGQRHSQPKFTHWHLLCTRTCACMPKAFFAIRLLNALRRASRHHPLAIKARESSLVLLEQSLQDASVRAAAVPLLLDMLLEETTQPYAHRGPLHIASLDASLGLQALVDLNCRPPDYYTFRTVREGILRCATCSGVLSSSINNTSGAINGIIDKNHKVSVSLRFLEAIDSVLMQVVVKSGGSQSNSSLQLQVTQALLSTLTSEGIAQQQPAPSTPALPPPTPSSTLMLRDMMHPFNRRILLNRIVLGETRILSSQQRPVLLTLLDHHDNVHRFLWKGGECLRQDYIVCLLGSFTQHLLVEKQELPNHSTLPKYRVLPLSPSSGLIEMVPDSRTVQGIFTSASSATGTGGTTSNPLTSTAAPPPLSNASFGSSTEQSPLLTYLLGLSTKPAERNMIATNFVRSAQFFILLNYIFKIGDRHRDNVLIRNDGCIFHVDFGMILDVKTVAEFITPAYVRFDADLEKCIHYFTSNAQVTAPQSSTATPPSPPPSMESSVTSFLSKTSEWFAIVRPYDSIFFLLLRHMVLNNIPAANSSPGGPTNATRVRAVSMVVHPHRRSDSGDSSSPSPPPPDVDCWWDPALAIHHRHSMSSVARSPSNSLLKQEVERLRTFVHDVFLRSMAESTCKAEFVRRVQQSRGREWVKDFTYGTKKRTTGLLSDLHARYVAYFQRDDETGTAKE